MSVVNLAEWLSQQPHSEFPGNENYGLRFQSVSTYLNREVHSHVEKGAILSNDGYLTDHGPEHIKTVIARASELLRDPKERGLSAYEIYLLLMAINFHDVGNLFGRDKHEQRHADIIETMGKEIKANPREKILIQNIARAHGGKVDGNKDTISPLPASELLFNKDVRPQLLAAILRFADELADDQTRAARFLMESDLIPTKSEIYHQYANILHTVKIDHTTHRISLRYSMFKDDVTKKFGKGKRKVYLLDEIYERTIKMHFERKYCGRFLSSILRLDSILVNIEVFLSQRSPTPAYNISYTLEDKGYPEVSEPTLTTFCPEVAWTGDSLMKDIQKKNAQ